MTTLLDRIRKVNKEVDAIRKELSSIDTYYSVPYEEMYEYYHLMKPKQAEKFIEGWVANLIGGHKLISTLVPEQYRQNDNGDLWIGNELTIGKNNIELKSSFTGSTIGGGQFRFYENVPYYLLFKSINSKQYEIFLLTKSQLVNEIVERAESSGKSAMGSSQGSGVFSKMDNAQKIQRLHENVEGLRDDKIGWGFNPGTEKEFYENFKTKYKVMPEDVRKIIDPV